MSFIVIGRIESEVHFAEFAAQLELRLNAALVEWGAMLLEAVQQNAPVSSERADFNRRRISPGVHLRDTFHISTFIRHGFGRAFPEVVVWSADPNAIWQEKGTRGRRKAQLKQYRTSGKGSQRNRTTGALGDRGTPPTYFISRAAREVFPAGIQLVQEAIDGLGNLASRTTLQRQITHMTKPVSVDTTTSEYVNRPGL